MPEKGRLKDQHKERKGFFKFEKLGFVSQEELKSGAQRADV